MGTATDGGGSSKTALILCVDEDERACALVVAGLGEFKVMCVPSGGRGLLLARRFPFDLYLFNARLPDLPGADFCRAIRSFDTGTPVVGYASASFEKEQEVLIAAGATLVLEQPMDLPDLAARIQDMIRTSWLHSAIARISEHAAVLDDLHDRSRAIEKRLQDNWQESERIRNRLLKIRAYKAFIEAGGSRANFHRIWPGMADSFQVKDR